MLVDGKGCWLSKHDWFQPTCGEPALFLDRDDVVLTDPGYLHRPRDVALVNDADTIVRWANQSHIPVILATNQSGIARGLYEWADFHAVTDRMSDLLAERNAQIDAVLACAWHEEGQAGLRHHAHPWRKPSPGMFHAAAQAFGIDLTQSWMVGDRASDMAAARHAGLRGGLWFDRDAACGMEESIHCNCVFRQYRANALLQFRTLLPSLFSGNAPIMADCECASAC